jgi:hypothetical protein
MNFSPYLDNPVHTKQTRTNNNISNQNRDNFFRPIFSNSSIPMQYNHEQYMIDQHYQGNSYLLNNNQLDIERSSVCTRNGNIDCKKPVQNVFQNDYHLINNDIYKNQDYDSNLLLTRNPVNTRRDQMEKTRNNEKQEFLSTQGGALHNFTDFKCENTRKSKNNIDTSNYLSMPRTMAIPKENI